MKNFCEDLFFFFLEIARKIFVKTFFFFFWRALALCVLGPWPWPRAFLSLASRVSVLGKAVLGLGLGFFCVLGLGLEPCVLDSTSGTKGRSGEPLLTNASATCLNQINYCAMQKNFFKITPNSKFHYNFWNNY